VHAMPDEILSMRLLRAFDRLDQMLLPAALDVIEGEVVEGAAEADVSTAEKPVDGAAGGGPMTLADVVEAKWSTLRLPRIGGHLC